MIGKTNAGGGKIKTKQLVGKGTLPFSTSDSKQYNVLRSEALKIDTADLHQFALDGEIYECSYGTLDIYGTTPTAYYRMQIPANDSNAISALTAMLSDANGNIGLEDGLYYIDVYIYPFQYLKYVFQCVKITISGGAITNVASFYSYNQYQTSANSEIYLYGIRRQ